MPRHWSVFFASCTTNPAVRFRMVPVIALPSSEAAKTAAFAKSRIEVSFFVCVTFHGGMKLFVIDSVRLCVQ